MNSNTGGSGSLPPRPRLRTSRSLPVVGSSGRSEPECDDVRGPAAAAAAAAAAAPAEEAQAPMMVTPSSSPAAAATANSRSMGLSYDDSLSPSTSLTSITSYEEGTGCDHEEEEEGDDVSSSASCWTPDTEAPTEADTTFTGRGGSDNDGGEDDFRIRPYGEDEESEALALAPGLPSHFAPSRTKVRQQQQHTPKHNQKQQQRSRNNRRRRRPGDGLTNEEHSDDVAKTNKATKLTRRISSDTFDSIAIGEGFKKITRRGGSGGRKGKGGMGTLLTSTGSASAAAARSITTNQFLQLVKLILFAIWVLLSMATVVHLHWFQGTAPAAVGGGHHPLAPIAGIDGPIATTISGSKGRLRGSGAGISGGVGEDSPSIPLIPPILYRPAAPRTHIPLPLPPTKASVVLMNFSRPRMIQESSLMRTLLSHPNVGEVILLHSNPKTAFHFVHPKVINVDSTRQNDEMGLSLRFYFCQLAKNPWVIHVDDDMEFSVGTLSELFIEFARNPKRIVGRFGRDTVGDENSNSFNGYSSRSSHKQTEVVLTKLMMMERDTCGAFFEHSHLIWEDTVLNNGEGPLWNGEDIFMSLVANHVYGHDGMQANYAMDWLNVDNAPDDLKDYTDGKYDISGGMTGYRLWDWHWWQSLLRRNRHYAYRGKLWQTARRRLAEL